MNNEVIETDDTDAFGGHFEAIQYKISGENPDV